MTGRTSRIRKCILFFQKSVQFWKNSDFVKNILGKKLIFFPAILKFLMTALDAQENFMPTRYCFFLSLLEQKCLVKNLGHSTSNHPKKVQN